jgi:hypothetical protein
MKRNTSLFLWIMTPRCYYRLTCGTGSAQYPPSMMLGLLICSDATGSATDKIVQKIQRITFKPQTQRGLITPGTPPPASQTNTQRPSLRPQYIVSEAQHISCILRFLSPKAC